MIRQEKSFRYSLHSQEQVVLSSSNSLAALRLKYKQQELTTSPLGEQSETSHSDATFGCVNI